jgi:hypothetical protein
MGVHFPITVQVSRPHFLLGWNVSTLTSNDLTLPYILKTGAEFLLKNLSFFSVFVTISWLFRSHNWKMLLIVRSQLHFPKSKRPPEHCCFVKHFIDKVAHHCKLMLSLFMG